MERFSPFIGSSPMYQLLTQESAREGGGASMRPLILAAAPEERLEMVRDLLTKQLSEVCSIDTSKKRRSVFNPDRDWYSAHHVLDFARHPKASKIMEQWIIIQQSSSSSHWSTHPSIRVVDNINLSSKSCVAVFFSLMHEKWNRKRTTSLLDPHWCRRWWSSSSVWRWRRWRLASGRGDLHSHTSFDQPITR